MRNSRSAGGSLNGSRASGWHAASTGPGEPGASATGACTAQHVGPSWAPANAGPQATSNHRRDHLAEHRGNIGARTSLATSDTFSQSARLSKGPHYPVASASRALATRPADSARFARPVKKGRRGRGGKASRFVVTAFRRSGGGKNL